MHYFATAFCILIAVKSFEYINAKPSEGRNDVLSPISLFLRLGIASCICAAIVGCSKSKEDIAMERVANRKPPAYIRLVNYGPDKAKMVIKGQAMSPDIATGDACKFTITNSGKQKVAVQVADKTTFEAEISMDPGKASSIVVGPTSTKIFDQEPRDGDPGQSGVRVIVVSSASPVSVQSDGSPLVDKLTGGSASDMKSVSPSHHKFLVKSGDGKMVEAEGDFVAGDAYTLFVNVTKEGATAKLEANSPMRKPIAQGGLAGSG